MAVLGAAGGIGQPLSLLLKLSPLIGELSLYDVANTPGVAADLSHISTGVRVRGYLGPQQLDAALAGCHLVVIPAGEKQGPPPSPCRCEAGLPIPAGGSLRGRAPSSRRGPLVCECSAPPVAVLLGMRGRGRDAAAKA